METFQTDQPPKILLVDDSLILLEIYAHHLERGEYAVYRASTGMEALRIAKEIVPDAILLDIMLPDIDGYEVCRRIKSDATLHATPVLFLSALDTAEDKAAGFEAGGADYISKTCKREELLARIQTHICLYKVLKKRAIDR